LSELVVADVVNTCCTDATFQSRKTRAMWTYQQRQRAATTEGHEKNNTNGVSLLSSRPSSTIFPLSMPPTQSGSFRPSSVSSSSSSSFTTSSHAHASPLDQWARNALYSGDGDVLHRLHTLMATGHADPDPQTPTTTTTTTTTTPTFVIPPPPTRAQLTAEARALYRADSLREQEPPPHLQHRPHRPYRRFPGMRPDQMMYEVGLADVDAMTNMVHREDPRSTAYRHVR
jgi:hypothetical protein